MPDSGTVAGSGEPGSSIGSWWALLLVTAIAAVLLARGAYNASNLRTVPDAVEYAAGASRLVAEGKWAIDVEGRPLPPRYPPWFSLLVLAPAYLILGPEPGNAIYPVTTLAVAGIVLAFALGRRASGPWGGAAAAGVVLVLPLYRHYGREVMFDVPAAALLLGVCLIYAQVRSSPGAGQGWYLLAGCLTAVATLFRPVFAAALLPFLLPILAARGAPRRLAVLVLPVCLAITAGLTYNGATFGSVLRSGYQFWCPVPYDYPSLTVSASYIGTNVTRLWASGLPLLLAGALAALAGDRMRRKAKLTAWSPDEAALRSTTEFLTLGAAPIVLFHLVYFFPSPRFFLPAAVVSAALLGSVVGRLAGVLPRSVLLAALAAGLLGASGWRLYKPDPPPYRRLAAERIREHTPDGAIVISAIDPVYLEYLLGDNSRRRIMPASRRVEYASKLIAWRKVPDPSPAPRSWNDHRCPGLLRGGAEEAVRAVAEEQLDALGAELAGGTRVFLDVSFLGSTYYERLNEELRRRFRFTPRAELLFELTPLP